MQPSYESYAFARVSAVVGLKVEDYFPLKKRWWLRLHEKGGKVNEMGCHHELELYLDEYITAAGIAADGKGSLFRTAIGRTGELSERSMSRVDAWYRLAIDNPWKIPLSTDEGLGLGRMSRHDRDWRAIAEAAVR